MKQNIKKKKKIIFVLLQIINYLKRQIINYHKLLIKLLVCCKEFKVD